jgi:hypothetical protein
LAGSRNKSAGCEIEDATVGESDKMWFRIDLLVVDGQFRP